MPRIRVVKIFNQSQGWNGHAMWHHFDLAWSCSGTAPPCKSYVHLSSLFCCGTAGASVWHFLAGLALLADWALKYTGPYSNVGSSSFIPTKILNTTD